MNYGFFNFVATYTKNYDWMFEFILLELWELYTEFDKDSSKYRTIFF